MAPTTSHLLTFLRHGESTGNAQDRWQGQMDFPLTDHGRSQSQSLARRWQQEKRTFDVVIASPLSRALETAEIIAGALGMGVEVDPVWLERDNGLFAGTERRSDPGDGLIPHIYHPIGESGETEAELFLRGGQAIATLLRRPPGSYLVVSHGGILNRAVAAALGIAPQPHSAGARFLFGNTGFATLEFLPDHSQWRVLGVNDLQHLSGDPVSTWAG